MASKYIAVENDRAHQLIASLDEVGIKWTLFGHDDIWSVIKMHGFSNVSNNMRTYERALELVGVIV
jgi:hypothetical protein